MGNKLIVIDDETDNLLNQCIEEYLYHHPEMKKLKISRKKIIFEIAGYYLR